jgi:hypothetical protein
MMRKSSTGSYEPGKIRHIDHGYAVTSDGEQDLTSERALVSAYSGVHQPPDSFLMLSMKCRNRLKR